MTPEEIASLVASVDFVPYIAGLVGVFSALALFYVAIKGGSMVIGRIRGR